MTALMRFALSTSPQSTTWPWLLEVWKRADDLSVFESAWTSDHLYPLDGDPSGDCLEGWVTLTALLQETRRIRGGVLVSGMVYRHPGLLAKMASTLDTISGGRLELGLGAGWYEPECQAYGIELGSLAERQDRFEEGVTIVDSLLTSPETTFEGRYYRLDRAVANPKPVQRGIPICIGGRGRRRTLPLAARYATHWNYPEGDVEDFRACRRVLFDACAAIGRDPAEITCSFWLRYTEPATLAADVVTFEGAGATMGIIGLPKSAPPSVVEDLASSLH